MTPNPILKVLSTLRTSNVRFLLMGGQACVLYGAAEFSRDTDVLIPATDENLAALADAIRSLDAERIAVPEFSKDVLERGHAVHFRCHDPEVSRMRLDVMTVLRGVDPFDALWERRTSFETADAGVIDVLSLPDLVAAKKTQRDKDWPMLRRLIEAHYAEFRNEPGRERIDFWLTEARTPLLIVELVRTWPDRARELAPRRPLLGVAESGDESEINHALEAEERFEREKDREYWKPLKAELERMRHSGSGPRGG